METPAAVIAAGARALNGQDIAQRLLPGDAGWSPLDETCVPPPGSCRAERRRGPRGMQLGMNHVSAPFLHPAQPLRFVADVRLVAFYTTLRDLSQQEPRPVLTSQVSVAVSK